MVTGGSNYCIVYGIVDSQQIQKSGIALIDKNGNLLKQTIWGNYDTLLGIFPGNSLVRTKDSGYVVCSVLTNALGADEGYLLKFNNNLDTLWTRIFTHPDTLAAAQPGADVFNALTAIKQTWDGGFIITGNYTKDCIQGNVRSYLLKTDSMGVMEWLKPYNTVGDLFDIQIAPDSGYIFSNLLPGFNITKTNLLGEIQWQLKPNNDGHLAVSAIGLTSDSCAILVSPHVYNVIQGTPLFGVDICKIRLSDHAVLWNKKHNLFLSFECYTLHQAFTLQILPNDYIVIGGTSMVANSTTSNSHKGVLLKLNPDGDSLWARYYGYGKFKDVGQFNDMVLTDDGGFMAVGTYLPIPPGNATYSAWLVKMDSLGCDTPGCHLIGVEELKIKNEKLEIFPNPFGEEMHIALPEEFIGGMLVLYDVQGCRAVETVVQEGYALESFVLQAGQLKPGVYLVELTGKDGRVWRRKAMKQ